MINAILGTTVLNANFCHNIRSVGKVTEHVFITPIVTGSNRTGILEDVVLSYYINKEKQVGKHRVDIFDEPTLFRNKNENIRILIPYCTGNHWVTCEILVAKRRLNVSIDVQLHDPYGHGLLNQDFFYNLAGAITLRILTNSRSLSLSIYQLTNSPSRFDFRRQCSNDDTSCGVIVCKEIRELAKSGTVVKRVVPYSSDEIQKIRKRHLEEIEQQGEHRKALIIQYGSNLEPSSFATGNVDQPEDLFAQVVQNLKSLQSELDEKKRLEQQDFIAKNLGKLKKVEGAVTNSLFRGSIWVFYNSDQKESFHIVANGKNLNIQCKGIKGQYIVQIQRIDINGNLVPSCADVLFYKDGKLQNAITISNIGQSSSRVQGLLDQVNTSGLTIFRADLERTAKKSWVDKVTSVKERTETLAL